MIPTRVRGFICRAFLVERDVGADQGARCSKRVIQAKCKADSFKIESLWASFFVAHFSRYQKKFQKNLDKHVLVWYTVRAKKQNVPRSHPAAKERARLIGHPFSGIFVVRSVALRDFLFHRVNPRKWRYFLLALQKIC